MMNDDDDDESNQEGFYVDGHWVWDEAIESLVFEWDLQPIEYEPISSATKAPAAYIYQFRDNADVVEQLRFKRKYQRRVKSGQPDVVTIQDLKDITLFTAPTALLSLQLIKILHVPTIERFLRALLLYCHYYLQIAETMTSRIAEAKNKIRTQQSELVENEFRENLNDLRVLVAKEYYPMITGSSDLKRFHHMGSHKKMISLSKKDAHLMESLIRMFVQIVWIGLGRKSFSTVEKEINRLLKSKVFNSAEHISSSESTVKMTDEEKSVLLGQCVRHDQKLNTRSPLINEVLCDRDVDFRELGLGVIKYEKLNNRLRYFEAAISYPEENFKLCGVANGILGLPRSLFNTFLKPIVHVTTAKSTQSFAMSVQSQKSTSSTKKANQLLPDLELPSKTEDTSLFPHLKSFLAPSAPIRRCNLVQRRRWESRYYRLLRCRTSISASICGAIT